MAIKSEIRKAINTGRYTCVKVWDIEVSEYLDGTQIMRVEVEVRRKKAVPKSRRTAKATGKPSK